MKNKIIRNKLSAFFLILLATCLMMVLITACDPLESSGYFGPEGQWKALIKSERAGLQALSDIPYYQINIEIDFDGGSYKGSAKIDYVNLEQIGLESLYFRLFPNGGGIYGSGYLKIKSVMVDGEEAITALSLDDSVMEVILPLRRG